MDIIYVLTNAAMPDYVKIGKTENLENRLKTLYNTSIPFPFECFFACRVEDADAVEKGLHEAFAKFRVAKNREFFEMLPGQVYAILKLLSKEDVTPKDVVVDSEENKEEVQKSLGIAREKRSAFNFKKAHIPIGSEIYFSRDENIRARVIDNRSIEYDGKVASLTAIATQLLGSKYSVQGPAYWMYESETLDERRKRIEEADDEQNP